MADELYVENVFYKGVCTCKGGSAPLCMCKLFPITRFTGWMPEECLDQDLEEVAAEHADLPEFEVGCLCMCGKGHRFKIAIQGGKVIFTDLEWAPKR